MILAAGLGKRMRPLTDHTPKPLLAVGGKPLLQYHLEALARSGVREVIINTAYLAEKIEQFAGDGRRFGLAIHYSREPEPLETGGAIYRALPLLGEAPFLLVNGDVWTDFPLQTLTEPPLPTAALGRLLLVPNPTFHPRGDFSLSATRVGLATDVERFTFAGISLLRPALVAQYPERRAVFPLLEALRPAIAAGRLEGRVHHGRWSDVGTPERLTQLEQHLQQTTES
ncbi:N-acetylmuramate alpha-1-phosphate uridylyltransferase MurU [Marinimicrobium sp. C6131]|uniref:N-acetylmuramate alpha-1-phosphate uridylyltransferase MurU n=1 Tax=Marinimicrobium sp. C6131 TaxID=3022676 RepID=UPI002AC82646|nr:nucleotidyltransferase family protein [Marinimicrobium sp. C6131]